jgi:hypothetical protein
VQQRELRVLREAIADHFPYLHYPTATYLVEINPLYPQLPQKKPATMVKESINLQNHQVCAKPAAR